MNWSKQRNAKAPQRAGWWMMGYALCSIIFGHIVIQRIVRIKV